MLLILGSIRPPLASDSLLADKNIEEDEGQSSSSACCQIINLFLAFRFVHKRWIYRWKQWESASYLSFFKLFPILFLRSFVLVSSVSFPLSVFKLPHLFPLPIHVPPVFHLPLSVPAFPKSLVNMKCMNLWSVCGFCFLPLPCWLCLSYLLVHDRCLSGLRIWILDLTLSLVLCVWVFLLFELVHYILTAVG